MVGRGWWVLVWTAACCWTECSSGGLTCQPGQEYFNDRQGQCVPCTRCHHTQVVVVPCYVYQDAVCASASQFVPNWSQVGQSQPPITLSPQHYTTHGGQHKATAIPSRQKTQNRENQGKSNTSESSSSKRKKKYYTQGYSKVIPKRDFDKMTKKHQRHSHHHIHRQDSRQTQSSKTHTLESEAESVYERKSAKRVRDDVELYEKNNNNNNNHETGDVRSGTSESLSEELINDPISASNNSGGNSSSSSSGGGNRTEEINEIEQQAEISGLNKPFFFTIIIIISVCLVVIIIAMLSKFKNILARRKLKRVYDGVPCESVSEEARGGREQRQHPTVVLHHGRGSIVTRGTVTYIRANTTSSTPTTTTTTTTTAISVETQRPSTQTTYPINPFTMDRLLEQRRVLGPASSVDTNLYIESWRQQDSHPVHHPTAHINIATIPSHCVAVRGSVSACPSPMPVRSYRSGPASASASPSVSIRGLNVNRTHVNGGLSPSVCV